jgi:hypothetical protein
MAVSPSEKGHYYPSYMNLRENQSQCGSDSEENISASTENQTLITQSYISLTELSALT